MHIHRPWRLVLSLLVAAAFAVPALAQQPPATTEQAPPPPVKKPPKHKPAEAPATTTEQVPPAPVKKPPKHKPADAPAATTAQAPTPPAKKPPKQKPAEAPAAAAPAPSAPPTAASGGAKPTLLGQYGEWGAYMASPGGKKVCFAIAKPTASETNPPNRPRNPCYMFISSRPADKVSNEVSIIIGYPFKPSSDTTVEVGPTSFALYTQQDGAWIKNAAEETRLIEAMRTGQSAVVKGMSSKGTRTTDTFSLKGLSQALDRTDRDCK